MEKPTEILIAPCNIQVPVSPACTSVALCIHAVPSKTEGPTVNWSGSSPLAPLVATPLLHTKFQSELNIAMLWISLIFKSQSQNMEDTLWGMKQSPQCVYTVENSCVWLTSLHQTCLRKYWVSSLIVSNGISSWFVSLHVFLTALQHKEVICTSGIRKSSNYSTVVGKAKLRLDFNLIYITPDDWIQGGQDSNSTSEIRIWFNSRKLEIRFNSSRFEGQILVYCWRLPVK